MGKSTVLTVLTVAFMATAINAAPQGENLAQQFHTTYVETIMDASGLKVAKPGSTRKPLTPEQRAKKPPVSQPIFRRHPITGRFVLYANVGYTMFIDGMDGEENAKIMDFLFRHQERAEYLYAHHWSVGDILMWDNIGTVHNAIGDYLDDEPRYMRRVQVMATLDYQQVLAGHR